MAVINTEQDNTDRYFEEKYQVFLENPLLSTKQLNLVITCQVGYKKSAIGFWVFD